MHDKLEKAKSHLKENKKLYIGLGIGAVAGGLAGSFAMLRTPEVQAVQKIIGPSWKPQQTIIQFVERSTPSRPLHRVGTKEYYDSVSDCARQTGLDRVMLSKHVNGYIPDVKGNVFEFVQPPAK